MSAICGFFQRRIQHSEQKLNNMLVAISEYGPDGSGQWANGAVALGHQRLVITPQFQQHKLPLYCSTSGLAITADVQLDNRADLIKIFKIPHSNALTTSDGELLLRAYQRWGDQCLHYLLGDFAFVIWDCQARSLFCARDPMGVKPFYYSLSAEQFAFASDINAVLVAVGVSEQLDEPYVAGYLYDKFFTHHERTFYRDVRKLPPGHRLTIDAKDVHQRRYWFPEEVPDVRFKSDDEYVDAFLDIYTQVTQDYVRCTDPVGVHLSGGLDSSSVTALTARQLRQQGRPAPLVFSWEPPPSGNLSVLSQPMYNYIQAVCDQEGLKPQYIHPSADDICDFFLRDPTRQPATGVEIHEGVVQRQAHAQGVRVLLSGWGGDHGISFKGRGYYSGLLWHGQWMQLYRESRSLSNSPWRFILSAFLPFVSYNAARNLAKIRQGKWPFRRQSFIHPDFARRIKPLHHKMRREISVQRAQAQALTSGDATRRLESWAASSAPHHFIYRYPLLDRRILEFALGLPPEQYRRGHWSRWLMRNALTNILPSEVCWNTDKDDTVRVQAVLATIPDALENITQLLLARSAPPVRGCYVDVPRLMEYLDPERFRARPKLGVIRAALQFLDIQ